MLLYRLAACTWSVLLIYACVVSRSLHILWGPAGVEEGERGGIKFAVFFTCI